MVLAQKWSFFNFSFLGNIGQENVSYDILEQTNTLLGYKRKKFKKSKKCNFSKGVSSWFWSKNGLFFNLFFLGNIGQENVFYDILERKKRLSRLQKQEFQKVETLTFFKRGLTHHFCPKMAIFQLFIFSFNLIQENVFYDILKR